MAQRKSIIATEERPASPLRRSSRINSNNMNVAPPGNTPTPVAGVVTRRRSSASDATDSSTPLAITLRGKRASMSAEPSDKPTTQTGQASSVTKTMSTDSAPLTPAKRGRKSSVSSITEEETERPASPAGSTRRRSVRAQSKSPTNENAAKPRGRRPSVTEKVLPMESIEESNEDKPEPKKATRATRKSTRLSSVEVIEEEKETKPVTRRSVRSQSKSPSAAAEEKAIVPELNPIDEENESLEKSVLEASKETVAEIKNDEKNSAENAQPESEKKEEEQEEMEINETDVSKSPVFNIEADFNDEELKTATEPISKEVQALSNEPTKEMSSPRVTDDVFETPTRKSPRVSTSVNAKLVSPVENKSPVRKSPRLSKISSMENENQSPKDQKSDNSPGVSKTESPSRKSPSRSPQTRKLSTSFSETAENARPITRKLSASFSGIAASPNKSQEEDARKSESENGDSSFNLDITVPRSSESDVGEGQAKKILNESTGSNNSDKENLPIAKKSTTPTPKRKSLSNVATASPKLNDSLKNLSGIENITNTSTEIKNVQVLNVSTELNESKRKKSLSVESKKETPKKSPVKKLSDDVESNEDPMDCFVDELNEDYVKQKPEECNKSIDKRNKSVKEESVEEISVDKNIESPKKNASLENSSNDSDRNATDEVAPSIGEEKETEAAKVKESVIVADGKGSKRRKLIIRSNSFETKLDELISQKLEEKSDSDDEDYQDKGFALDEASEGEEDTPSEGSNDIIDEGESLHSSESENLSDDEDYDEDDSFIADDDDNGELLPGDEYDLDDDVVRSNVQKKQKRKSRIIKNPDSSSDDINENSPKSPCKIQVLEQIVIPAGSDLLSPTIKQSGKEENGEENKSVLDEEEEEEEVANKSIVSANNSLAESPQKGRRNSRRKTSLTIQEQINVNEVKEGNLNDRINKAVDFFVSSLKETTGNVRLNVSLDYAQNSNTSNSDEDHSLSDRKEAEEDISRIMPVSPNKKNNSVEEETENEDFTKIISDILNNSNQSGEKKKKSKKRLSNSLNVPIGETPKSLNSSHDSRSSKKRSLSPSKSSEGPQSPLKKSKNSQPPLQDVLKDLLGERFETTKKGKVESKKRKEEEKNVSNKKFKPSNAQDVSFTVDDEIKTPKLSKQGTSTGILKKKKESLKPSKCSAVTSDWEISTSKDNRPSKTMLSEREAVKAQLEHMNKKMLSNDFKNQMMYRFDVPRMNSKKVIKNKARAGYSANR